MATRIHNFSYSGTTGLLQFVPCTGDEKACKVYIKSILANLDISSSTRIERKITLSTKAANNTTSLTKAYWLSWFLGNTTTNVAAISLSGSCTALSSDWKLLNQYQPDGYTTSSNMEALEQAGSGYWPSFEKITWSGKGFEQWLGIGWIRHDIPEYFYMKPGDTLTFAGYTGTFHIELMAISES